MYNLGHQKNLITLYTTFLYCLGITSFCVVINMKEKKAIKESESDITSSQATPSGQSTVVGGIEVKKGYNTWKLVIFGLAFMAPALSLLATFPLVLVAGYTWMGIPLI